MSLFIISLLGTLITNDYINKTLIQVSEHIVSNRAVAVGWTKNPCQSGTRIKLNIELVTDLISSM